jgi:hypothetical protein
VDSTKLLWATDLEEDAIKRGEIEPVTASQTIRLVGYRYPGGLEPCMGSIDLGMCFLQKADVETIGILRWLLLYCTWTTEYECEALAIVQNCDDIALLFFEPKIEEGLEEGTGLGEICHTEIEVIEPHGYLLYSEARCGAP